ncbi:MAG: hypothetical protein ACM3U2_15610 [Deltaproteobacteria bacterium]
MAPDESAPTATVADRPEETPAAAATAGVDAETIQNQLHEKERLVAALTERLEQAAEQLDRMRRTGGDKGRRPLGMGFPPEVVEEHKHTLEDLKRVITNWEETQPGATLGRIETQIVELRDLITSSLHGGTFTASPSAARVPAAPATSSPPSATPPRERAQDAPAPASGGKSGNNAWWEAQKAALMGEPVPAEVQATLAAAETPAAPEPRSEEPAPLAAACDLAAIDIPDLPAPVDLDNITLDDARAAIRERDRIIQQLREPLLLVKASGQLPADLNSLENLPEPVRARITELETQWQAKFRQVELDLSLERARLAREQAAVRQQQESLQKQLRRGAAAGNAFDDDGARGEESSSSKRRWFRFMGKTEENGGGSGQKDEGQ